MNEEGVYLVLEEERVVGKFFSKSDAIAHRNSLTNSLASLDRVIKLGRVHVFKVEEVK